MTTVLDIIRYNSGIAGEEVADMVDSLEREVSSLREQVENARQVEAEAAMKLGESLIKIGTLEEQVEKLTRDVEYWKADSAAAWDKCEERRIENAKLTKERDELKTVPMKYRRMQFNAELQDEVTQLQKQLAALAERIKELETEFAGCSELLNNADRIMEQQSAALKLAKDALQTLGQYYAWLNFGECRTYGEHVPIVDMRLADLICKEALAAIDALGE